MYNVSCVLIRYLSYRDIIKLQMRKNTGYVLYKKENEYVRREVCAYEKEIFHIFHF